MKSLSLFPSLPALPTWAVTPVDGYGKHIGPPVHVRAGSKESAETYGRDVIRQIHGRRGRFGVLASPYSPLHDPAFRGYVRALTGGEHD
jgi:hypothetical protein